jgi:hypothetical protein
MQTMHTIYSEPLVQQISRKIPLTGISDSSAALCCHVSPRMLARWIQDHLDLAIRLRATRANFCAVQITIIASARLANGRRAAHAARWLLDHTFSSIRTADASPNRPDGVQRRGKRAGQPTS